jgi:hypothetical protein
VSGIEADPPDGVAPDTAVSPKATATPIGRKNVILERIEEQQRVVIEAVTSTREELGRRIDALDTKLSSKIDTLEFAVRKNSADIQSLSEKLGTKADSGRVSALELTVQTLASPAKSS